MLYYDRFDISKAIGLAKSNNSKECMICHYCLFNHGFEIQDSVCNSCHDLIILCLSISSIAIITVENADYRCNVHDTNKSEVTNLSVNSVPEDHGYIKHFVRLLARHSKFETRKALKK